MICDKYHTGTHGPKSLLKKRALQLQKNVRSNDVCSDRSNFLDLTKSPLTSCSNLSMTCTAWWRIVSLVCGLSWFMWIWTMWPSSLNASLISRTRSRSLALFAILLSFSRFSLSSTERSWSSSSFADKLKIQKLFGNTEAWCRFEFIGCELVGSLTLSFDFLPLCRRFYCLSIY